MADESILHERVRNALRAAQIAYETLPCDPALADTLQFCSHYGIAATEACNAIVVALKTTPRTYVACLVRSDTRLDVNRRISELTGIKRLSFASADETAALTGMLIGGVTVAGMPPDVPVYIDARVMEQPRVILGGGNRSSKIRVEPQELLKLPNVRVEDIALPRE